MAATLPDSGATPEAARGAGKGGGFHGLLREPLLHFLALGAVLFAVDHIVVSREDDPRTILVGAAVEREAREVFRASRNREPEPAELEALRRRWLDNEILYREGLALRVDRGDDAIRERVIFKALSVVDAGLKPPPQDEASLRAWFEANRARYDTPARFDFEEAVLHGETSEGALRDFAAALNKGTPGEAQASLRIFKGRPRDNIVQSYGEDFARELAAAQAGPWTVLRAGKAWRVMRLVSATPARPADFESLRGVVLHDYTDARMAEARTEAVRALGKRYTVRYEGAGS